MSETEVIARRRQQLNDLHLIYEYRITPLTSRGDRVVTHFTNSYEVLPSGCVSARNAVRVSYSSVDEQPYVIGPICDRVVFRHRTIEITACRPERKSE